MEKPRAPEAAYPKALRAGKTLASITALWLFVLGVSLDDLHLVRLPMLWIGAAAAILAFALLPVWFAARLMDRVGRDDPHAPDAAIDLSLQRRRAGLAFTIGGFVLWLVLFSSGRTPRL